MAAPKDPKKKMASPKTKKTEDKDEDDEKGQAVEVQKRKTSPKDSKVKKMAAKKDEEEGEDEEAKKDEEETKNKKAKFEELTEVLDTDDEKGNETRCTFEEDKGKVLPDEKFVDKATEDKAERLMHELYKTRGLTTSNDDLVVAQRKMMRLRKEN